MSDFVNSITQYFMNFLETDFRKRRLPKRSIERSDRSGNLMSIDLIRFPTFHKTIISNIADKDSSFSIKVMRNQHKSNFSTDAFDVAIKRATQDINNISDLVHEEYAKKLEELYKNYFEDPDTFLQEAVYTLRELLINTFIANSTNLFTSTIIKDKNANSEDNLAICDNIAEIITTSFEGELNDCLKNYLVDNNFEPISPILDKILDVDFINLKYVEVFQELKVSDLFTSIHELNSNKKLSENLQLYLYFGRVNYGNRNYPLFFLPIELNEILENDKTIYKLEFDKVLYINKNAIEYIFQESNNDTSAKISTELGERIIYLDEDESLSQSLNSLIDKLLASFKTDGEINFESQLPAKSVNKLVTFDNRINLALFDKADESNLNDYEELLGHLKDNSKIAEIFNKLILGFIEEEPDVIIQDINDTWDRESYQDKLVYASPIPLNEEQRKILNAINNSSSKYITVQGPPGTGKSHTIAAILFEAIFKNKSTLMLSDKKEALDVVESKLEEVLNKTRLQEHNSQNPILRLGKQGNTYNKILQTGNINQIREHLKLSSQMLKDDDTASITDKTKNIVQKNKDKYTNINSNDIRSYLISRVDLCFDDVEERTFRHQKNEFDKLKEKITSLKSFFQSKNLIEYLRKIGAESAQQIIEALTSLAISSSAIEKYGSLNYLNKFYTDKQYLKQKVVEYNNKKQQMFGLFLNKRLEVWNNDLNNTLPLKSYVDFRSSDNLGKIQKLMDINYHIEARINNQTHDLDRNLIESNLLLNQSVLLHNDAIKYTSTIEQLLQIMSNEDLDVVIKKLDITKVNKNFLNCNIEELITKFELITFHLEYFDKIQKDFDIEHLNLSQENEKIYETAAIEMSHNFNKRFVEFMDTNRTKALTLKKIISSKQPFPREDLDILKNAFPCIIAGIRDYADYIPMEPELFDLIIIDEASQVSIAQAFPAVLRAKKIIILGDKKQFSNVKSATSSNAINNVFQDDIRVKFKEKYKNDIGKFERSKIFNIKSSILEFFENVSNFDITLRKHFRGYPEIISFSSKNFYDGSLQAVKVRAKPINDVIEFHKLEHDGKIETSNINTIECNFIIREIEKLLELDEPPSVGVLTPMKDQQKFILSEIEKSQHYYDMQKLDIKVMTFDSCQGEERDIIFYSFVDSPVKNISYSVLGNKFDLSTQDPESNQRIQRLNVGMSRAKEKIIFVLSMDVEKYAGNTHRILNHYMQELESGKKIPDISETESPMEAKLLHWISVSKFYQTNKASLDLIAQFDVGKYLKTLDPTYNHPNYRSDFLLTYTDGNKTKKLIIEYDGLFEHFKNIESINEYNYQFHYSEKDLEREKILESYGFPLLRFNKFNITDDPISEVSNRLESFFLQKDQKHH